VTFHVFLGVFVVLPRANSRRISKSAKWPKIIDLPDFTPPRDPPDRFCVFHVYTDVLCKLPPTIFRASGDGFEAWRSAGSVLRFSCVYRCFVPITPHDLLSCGVGGGRGGAGRWGETAAGRQEGDAGWEVGGVGRGCGAGWWGWVAVVGLKDALPLSIPHPTPGPHPAPLHSTQGSQLVSLHSELSPSKEVGRAQPPIPVSVFLACPTPHCASCAWRVPLAPGAVYVSVCFRVPV